MADLWSLHKEAIERLFLVEGKTLDEVMVEMEQTHSFSYTYGQHQNESNSC